MSRKILLVVALALGLLGAASATRVLEQPEGAYELKLENVVLPQSTAGYVIFKTCAACDQTSMNVAASTVYLVERSAVSLAAFLEAAESFRQMDDGGGITAVYVFYDVESRRVNRLVLDHLGG
jgi:hypothetical protein